MFKSRGDAIPVPMYHNGKRIGTAWRRPFVIHIGGEKRDMVRFNYGMFALETQDDEERIILDGDNYDDFATRPKRYNVVDVNLHKNDQD